MKKRQRQSGALHRLQEQLRIGKKNTKDGPVILTESDQKRILKEINILTTKYNIS